MKIYFSGSISGGRDYQTLYAQIIDHLKSYGTVLTEHIGQSDLSTLGEDEISNEAIYTRDVDWIREADLFIAEVSTPSLGVGYEVALAEHLKIPMLCLYHPSPSRRLSAMIAGNPAVQLRTYHNADEATNHIDIFIKALLPHK